MCQLGFHKIEFSFQLLNYFKSPNMNIILPLNAIFRLLLNQTNPFQYIGDVINSSFLSDSKLVCSLKVKEMTLTAFDHPILSFLNEFNPMINCKTVA